MKASLLSLVLFCFIQSLFGQLIEEVDFEDYDIVLLGEQAHGIKSFYEEKYTLIELIDSSVQEELVLFFESPLILSIISYLENGVSDYHYHLNNTEENIDFFSKYKNFGFDLQEDCRYTAFSEFLVKRAYCDPKDKDMLKMDSILGTCINGKNFINEVLTEGACTDLKSAIRSLKLKVLQKIPNDQDRKMLDLCFENRLHLAQYMHLDNSDRYQQRIQFRDSIMAVNISQMDFLKNDSKVVISAANLHVGLNGVMGKAWANDGVKSMAEYLAFDYDLYSIAIDSKKRKKDVNYFDLIIVTDERIIVEDKYLVSNCK
jgi:hypothetical protein